MVQIILHTTANLKGSDIPYNTQPQTLHCNPSPALTSPSIFDNRPALASQAPPGLSSPSFSLRNAGTKRGYETRTASVPSTNRVPIYRIRTPESSDLPITATGDNPSNHSLHSTYTRRAKTVRTAHYLSCPPYPPSKEIQCLLAAAARQRVTADRYAMLSNHSTKYTSQHHTTAPHQRTRRSRLIARTDCNREEAMNQGG
jgi:hypothetical protein